MTSADQRLKVHSPAIKIMVSRSVHLLDHRCQAIVPLVVSNAPWCFVPDSTHGQDEFHEHAQH